MKNLFKIFKEELLFVPIMALILEGFRRFIMWYYPETALFDRGSMLETFLFRVWQIVWITASCWLLIRVALPPAYFELRSFYHNFKDLAPADRRNIALKVFLMFFFGLVLLLSGSAQTNILRARLVDTLEHQLQVRELTGNNDGPEVERYLKFVKQSKGAPWCAAFVSWNLNAVGVTAPPNPKTAWSPAFAEPKYQVWSQQLAKSGKRKFQIRPGDVFTLYFPNLKRVGHTGFITAGKDNYWYTIEGNTAPYGSREGDGVYKLKRPKAKIYAITNFIDAPRS